MKLVDTISLAELTEMARRMTDEMVKGVVDVERQLLVLDADMHADEEEFLLDDGSRQEDLWGINLYPGLYGTEEFVEFDSMINIRPRLGNRTRGVADPQLRDRIVGLVATRVTA